MTRTQQETKGQKSKKLKIVSFLSRLAAYGAAAFAVSMQVVPAQAWAADTLGSVVCRISKNLVPYGDFIAAVCLVAGIFLSAVAVFHMKANSDGSSQHPPARIIMFLVAGVGLISMPEIASVVQSSVVGTVSANGSIGCTPGTVTAYSASSSSDASAIFKNLFNDISGPLQAAMSALCLVVGAFFVAKGLLRASKYGQDGKSTVSAIMSNLIIGSVLLSAGQLMDIVMQTVFGVTTSSAAISNFSGINWSNTTGSTDMTSVNEVIKSVLTFVQVIGIIGFVRGWMIIKAAVEGSGQATIAQGSTFIIGGIMAVNIGNMIVIFNKTFGLNVVSS